MNIQQMMKQAQQMQKKLEAAQKELADKTYEAASGGGMVKLSINGKGELLKISLDKSLICAEEAEMLEDLIVAAFNQAKKHCDQDSADIMSNSMNGVKMPEGFKLPF